MPRVPVHTVQSAPEGSRDDLKALEAQFGKVLNIFGEMAHAPTVIGLFAAAEGTIAERTSLDRKTREAIHLTVAQVNECRYCQSAYTGAAKMAGFSDDEAIAIRRGHVDFDERLAALLPVA
jgi:AhpD family alkylhydroperoxidase